MSSASDRRGIARLILVAAGGYVISACWHIFFGGQNIDEGFYVLAARAVWQGEVPYRDFGYTQMPLLPYINGLFMQLIGFGLFEQRAVNGLWAALTLLLSMCWLSRRTGPAWAIAFSLILSFSAPWMYFMHLGKTYALTGLAVIAALWVFTEWKANAGRVILLSLLGTLGAGCRLSAAPFFAVLWLVAVSEFWRSPRRMWWGSILGSVLCPLVLLLPFYWVAPETTLFWTFDFHRISVPNRTWHQSWRDISALAPALWLGLTFGVIYAAATKNRPNRREVAVLGATLLGLAANLLPQGAYEEYGVPFLPPLALMAGLALWQAGAAIHWLRHLAAPIGLLILNLGVSVSLLWIRIPADRRGTCSVFLPLNAPAYNVSLPANLERARRVVRDYLRPDQLFIGPHLILAAETGRPVPRTLRMGAFTATREYAPEKARQLNLATYRELDSYIKDPGVPLLAYTKNPILNYAWSLPSFTNLAEPGDTDWFKIYQRDFVVAYEDDEFLILVRKDRMSLSIDPH